MSGYFEYSIEKYSTEMRLKYERIEKKTPVQKPRHCMQPMTLPKYSDLTVR
jgi:hypothetical protein